MSPSPGLRSLSSGAVLVLVGLVAAACGDGAAGGNATSTPAHCADGPVERLVPVVERRLPHDPTSFTQGLVVDDGTLFESTGLVGRSRVIAAEADTGTVRDSVPAPDDVFAEGLAVRSDGRLVQLTWTDGRAFVRDPSSLEVVDELSYDGEGWGLSTLDDGTLIMSDGTDRLTERDPDTFEEVDAWTVTRPDGSADLLNELEWDGEHLWANRWRSDEIVRIDVACRRVDGVVDASSLSVEAEAAATGDIDVLNGVAHLPGSDRYLVTGKLWPITFEVSFEPAGSGGP